MLALATTAIEPLPLAKANEIQKLEVNTDQFVIKYKAGSEPAEAIQNSTEAEGVQDRLPAEEQKRIDQALTEEKAQLTGSKAGAQNTAMISLNKELSENDAESLVENLENDADVEFVEPVYIARPNNMNADEIGSGNYASYQWNLDEDAGINVAEAWRYSQGEGVTVAVLDTGIVDHPELNNKLVPGADMISNPSFSRDYDGRDMNPRDEGDWMSAHECGNWPERPRASSWHGTHVAGIIGAERDGSGIDGIAPKSSIQPVRVLGRCGGTSVDIADGIIWAAGGDVPGMPHNQNPAQVINLSLGGNAPQCPHVYQNAINEAIKRGATVVVAAGNESQNARYSTPANCEGVITVGATGAKGEQSSFSNYGPNLTLSAPGGNGSRENQILSAGNSSSSRPGKPNYIWMQGTSQATPHVTGVAALLKSKFPEMTPLQVKDALVASTKQIKECRGGCGQGLLDAPAALRAAASIVKRNLDSDDEQNTSKPVPESPVKAPVKSPVKAPVKSPVKAPVKSPARARVMLRDFWLDSSETTGVDIAGFEPGEDIVAFIDNFNNPIGSVKVNEEGRANAFFSPDKFLKRGYHILYIQGEHSGRVAGTTFHYLAR